MPRRERTRLPTPRPAPTSGEQIWFHAVRWLPLLATAVVAATGDIYAGLWYPIVVAVMTLVVGAVFLRDTKGVDITTSSGVAIQKSSA